VSYLIYGKHPKDKKFKALKYDGSPTHKLAEAGEYATIEDAQEVLDKRVGKNNPHIFEIRKAK
jgi:hypothetical protein